MTAPTLDLTTDAGRDALTQMRLGHPDACPDDSVAEFVAIQQRLRTDRRRASTRSRDVYPEAR